MSQKEIEILKRALTRERIARKEAEEILEKKSFELYKLYLRESTSKKKLEALIQLKKSELKGFQDNLVDPYILIDLLGNVIKMNDAAIFLLGYDLNEASLNLMDLTLPRDKTYIESSFVRLYTQGSITDFYVRIVTKSMGIRLMHANISVIYDENHEAVASQGILRDITQEKQAKEELLESEERLSTLILSLDSSVLLEDEKGKIILTNQNFCNLFKINDSPIKIKGENYLKLMNERKFLFKNFNSLIVSTEKILAEKNLVLGEEIKLNDGLILERNYIPILKNKKYKGHLWSFKNVTLYRNYQKSLEAERLKYSSIIDNMNLGLLETDINDKILYANQCFIDMSGYTLNEIQGKLGTEVFLDESGKDELWSENEKRKKGLSNSYEIKIKNKKGEARYWLVSGAPNYNINGEVIGSIGVHLDITNLKKLEEQKESLLNKLEVSNESLQEYAYVVSHDLKTPLRSIDALISWIKEDNVKNLDEVTIQNFKLIEKTLEKMENLINNVLKYSSVGADLKMENNIESGLLIKDLLDTIYIPEHIVVHCDYENLPVVKGDRIKLEQVFQNLLSNAIKFSDKEKGWIKVLGKVTDTHYEFSISDNGIGISKIHHDKIFNIFNSLHKRKDSTGIGLSIVKKIIELHDGKVWLDSEPNIGSTFYFTLKKSI